MILILGYGQLGSELASLIPDSLVVYRSQGPSNGVRMDVTDFGAIEDLILKRRPKAIINTVAVTDVDACEVRREEAFKTNGEVVRHLARVARVVEAHLIHVSTDYVFDGEKGMYSEVDVPNPINYYGLTKLVGESYALSYDDSLVVRTSGVYGRKGFPLYVYNALREGKEVKAFRGYFSPTWARALAEAIVELLKLGKTGVLHVAGPRVSRYELALSIAERMKLKELVREVEEVPGWRARRPLDSSLDSSRARRLLSTDFQAQGYEKLFSA
ncbi:MAG: NAD(P)-dependent oxidoreductase [Metallosphaera yellowstonensis]